MAELLSQRKWQIIASIPTFLYFFFLLSYLSPGTVWRDRVTAPINSFWNYWRLDQNWNLFSPVIRDINHHTSAVITFEDGTKALVELPRSTKLGLAGKFKDEMWRKWAGDSLPFPPYKEFRPDLARYIGRRFYNPANKPVTLSLSWFFTHIPPPSVNPSQTNLPYHNTISAIFEYKFTPEDFE
jgi:hypothetical protein